MQFIINTSLLTASIFYFRNAKTLEVLFEDLSKELDPDARKNIININRDNPLDGMIRAVNRPSFNPAAPPSVLFLNNREQPELGIDAGGPTRECFRLCISSLCKLPLFKSYSEQHGVAIGLCQKSKIYSL